MLPVAVSVFVQTLVVLPNTIPLNVRVVVEMLPITVSVIVRVEWVRLPVR